MDRNRRVVIGTYVLIAMGTAIATAVVAALLVNIFERKQEARNPFLKLIEVGEDDVDPAKWGVNWPRQYDGYLRTSEPTATKYGGSQVGPEGSMPPQKADRDPWLRRIFAGYLFAVDYRDRRGHAFMLHDQEVTKRNVPGGKKQSGNCLHCHASVMPLYRRLGAEALPHGTPQEQVQRGLEAVAGMDYWDAHQMLTEITGKAHPVSCVDCHDPATMELRVTRPAFLAGMRRLAASDAPVPHLPSVEQWRRGSRSAPYDPNVDGTRQEMRSYVCGQCHVEYYCGKGMTIFFPWDRGLKAEEIEATYDGMTVQDRRFKDWTHAETGVEVLKAQHPEFEVWSQGIHARSGVACADCHMPYKREGALKVSEHWVRSPLLQIPRACATCHPYGEKELETRVEAIQDRHFALLTRAGEAAVAMLDALVAVRKGYDEAGWQEALEKDPEVRRLGELQRAAQWRLDFVAAENSMGFHAPQELARLLAESIDLSRQAEIGALRLLARSPTPAAAPGQNSKASPADPPIQPRSYCRRNP
ncbi:MAG TPA: ammonia-forming cytochrome c nitrite reductase subunit c552 [Myxococcota bacterium]|nr:ammonia-forming cytochrome c nitrite reductase subunit c552 [Myxococcota bacterium]HQK49592.1 ammonia-forming cytochrome c nitrite reductase subunit c552 [Myxococcota bacterium]